MRHLDTNIVIEYLRHNKKAVALLESHRPHIAISAVVWGELLYGAKASGRVAEKMAQLRDFATYVPIINFDQLAAEAYSQLRMGLRQKRRNTSGTDALIAAVALSRQAILVTNNTRHFQHIDGLTLEDWLSS